MDSDDGDDWELRGPGRGAERQRPGRHGAATDPEWHGRGSPGLSAIAAEGPADDWELSRRRQLKNMDVDPEVGGKVPRRRGPADDWELPTEGASPAEAAKQGGPETDEEEAVPEEDDEVESWGSASDEEAPADDKFSHVSVSSA